MDTKEQFVEQVDGLIHTSGIDRSTGDDLLSYVKLKLQMPQEPRHWSNPPRRQSSVPTVPDGLDNSDLKEQLEEQLHEISTNMNLSRITDAAVEQASYLGRIADGVEGILKFHQDSWHADQIIRRQTYEKLAKADPSILLKPISMDSLKEQVAMETLDLVMTVTKRTCGDNPAHKSHLGLTADVVGSIRGDIQARRDSRTGFGKHNPSKPWDA